MEAARSLYEKDPDASKVDLSGLNIESLELIVPVIEQFTALLELDLSENHLTSLPGDLSRLSKLRVLDLKGNSLTELSEALASLQTLESLEELSLDIQAESDKDIIMLELPQLLKLNGDKLIFDFGETSHQPTKDTSAHEEAKKSRLTEGQEGQILEVAASEGHFDSIGGASEPTELSTVQSQETASIEVAMSSKGETGEVQALEEWRHAEVIKEEPSGEAEGVEEAKHSESIQAEEAVKEVEQPAEEERTFEDVKQAEVIKAEEVGEVKAAKEVKLTEAIETVEVGEPKDDNEEARMIEEDEVKQEEQPDNDLAMLQFLPLDEGERALVEAAFSSLDAVSYAAVTSEIETLLLSSSLDQGSKELQDLKTKFNIKHLALSHLVSAKSPSSGTVSQLLEALAEHFEAACAVQSNPLELVAKTVHQEAESLHDLEIHQTDLLTEHLHTEALSQEKSQEAEFTASSAPIAVRGTYSQRLPHPSPYKSVKALTLKQLRDVIEEIYASKQKYDQRCQDSQQPRETMEQHMHNFLNQKYGLKRLINDWASAILAGVERFARDDNDVAVFGKVLRNQCDENFCLVQQQIKATIAELLKVLPT
jgi:hypothetical protein